LRKVEELINQHLIMSSLNTLSRREREVMEILFALGEGTLTEVAEKMPAPPTRPAMRSILVILIEKGHVMVGGKHSREHVYRPLRQPTREGAAAWRRVLNTFFGGSVKRGLAAYLADPEAAISADELKEIESLIRAARRRTTQK
jgi:predicted transcriptional regulator